MGDASLIPATAWRWRSGERLRCRSAQELIRADLLAVHMEAKNHHLRKRQSNNIKGPGDLEKYPELHLKVFPFKCLLLKR